MSKSPFHSLGAKDIHELYAVRFGASMQRKSLYRTLSGLARHGLVRIRVDSKDRRFRSHSITQRGIDELRRITDGKPGTVR